MDVAVVIPLFNKGRYIARALDSVLAQTVPPAEIVIIDDGSTDGGGDIVRRYPDKRIRLVRQENCGVSAARNRGIAEASTELIAFLDADDEWKAGFMDTALQLQNCYPECGALATAYELASAGGRRRSRRFKGMPPPPWEGVLPNYFRSAPSFPICSSAVAVPRRVFDTVGTFPEGVPQGEDLDTWCRIALRYPIAFSTSIQATFHWDVENRTHTRNAPPHYRAYPLLDTIDAALDSGEFPLGVTREDLIEYRNSRLIGMADGHVDTGKSACAREHLRMAAATRRFRLRWARSWVRSFVPAAMRASLRGLLRPGGRE